MPREKNQNPPQFERGNLKNILKIEREKYRGESADQMSIFVTNFHSRFLNPQILRPPPLLQQLHVCRSLSAVCRSPEPMPGHVLRLDDGLLPPAPHHHRGAVGAEGRAVTHQQLHPVLRQPPPRLRGLGHLDGTEKRTPSKTRWDLFGVDWTVLVGTTISEAV